MKRSLFLCCVLAGGAVVSARPLPVPRASDAPIRVAFEAVVNGEPFRCGQHYAGIGTTKSSITVSDFRFYVSDLQVVDASGAASPVALEQDGKWQHGDVALLDFEDGTATCANGTPETRAIITGTAPAGGVGLRFRVGLPFDVNHRDVTLQPSPLNLSRLFWNWNAGYKFARIDMKSTGQPQGWVLHLGSTNCMPSSGPNVVPDSCAHENTPAVAFAAFDPARDTVRMDLGALLAGSNVDTNTPNTAAGCMSGQTDPECGPIFKTLGLPFGDEPVAAQTVFTVAPRPAATVR